MGPDNWREEEEGWCTYAWEQRDIALWCLLVRGYSFFCFCFFFSFFSTKHNKSVVLARRVMQEGEKGWDKIYASQAVTQGQHSGAVQTCKITVWDCQIGEIEAGDTIAAYTLAIFNEKTARLFWPCVIAISLTFSHLVPKILWSLTAFQTSALPTFVGFDFVVPSCCCGCCSLNC